MAIKAQYPEYGVGVRGGTTWSFMMLNPSVEQPSMPLTFHTGAQFRMISERYFGIKVELNYDPKYEPLDFLRNNEELNLFTIEN